MKAFRRVLAMLAVIAIAVSGFAFAEEPVLVAALSEVVIEEIAGESIETAEEPAAEEAAEEAAVELSEEPAAEEEAEEPAAEAIEVIAEADSEESDMPETIDVPVVMSLLHRDEVPGDCPHTNEYITDEGRWNIEVFSTDAKNHTIRYEGEEYYYCPDCGYEYYLPIIGQRETTEEHRWAGDHCWVCNYVNTCTHANKVLGHTSKWDITVLSTDALSHTVQCRMQHRYDCPDCDNVEWVEVEGYQTITEAHDWNRDNEGNSYCWVCEYVNACAHEEKYIEHEGRADEQCISSDATTHTIEFKSEILFECLICGYRGWELSEDSQTITEAHDWYEGRCWVCDAVNSCTHPNAVAEPYEGRANVNGVSISNTEHRISYNACTYYDCPDCGAGYEVVSPEITTVTERHDWNRGVCTECNARNSCTHPNLITENVGHIPQQVISYDENQHTCVFIERTWYYCPDCAENIWEDSAESFTDTEPHVWWDGRCELCPAVNPCTHENQYVDYVSSSVVEVISVTRDSHTIKYREEYLYICPDCKQESWEMQDEILTKTEAHDWYEGECHLCDAVNTCAHKNRVESHNYWEIVKVLSTTAQKHVAEVRDYTYYDCEDCGESFRELADTTYTRSAAHEWDELGYCYECNYRNACTHPNSVVNSYYDSWGNGKQVDARTHTCSHYYEEYNVCPDCGYRSEIRRTQETRLENHDFNSDGVCRICEYKTSCAHKNTHTADSWRYVSCVMKDSKSHIYTYSIIIATICSDCGAELSCKDTGSEKNEECHCLDAAGICIDCGYESSCTHAGTKTESYTDEYARPYDVNSHIVISEKSESVICTSCDAFLTTRNVNKITGTKLVKHSFRNGQCTECELYEVECVHEFDKNGKCKLCGKTAGKELESITVDASLTMYVDDKLYLSITLNPSGADADLEFSSSKSSVVSVDKNGMLTAKKAGEATITVKSGKISAKCVVTVLEPCKHKNASRESSYVEIVELISYDAKGHTGIFRDIGWYYCPDCKTDYEIPSETTYASTLPHEWWEGECEYCPAVNDCKHPDEYLDYSYDAVSEVLSSDASTHTVSFQTEYEYICPDCGQIRYESGEGGQVKTEPHSWEEGVCWVCDAKNSCKHKNKGAQYQSTFIEDVVSSDAKKHTLLVRDMLITPCLDCGEEITEMGKKTYESSEAHWWDPFGVCGMCGRENSCKHAHTQSYKWYSSNSDNAKPVDSRTHSVVNELTNFTECLDCGITVKAEVLSSEEAVESHMFNGSACWLCGYVNTCAHENSEKAEWEETNFAAKSKNKKTHSYTSSLYEGMVCSDCGEILTQKLKKNTTVTEPHYFDGADICFYCGYETSCAHSKTTVEKETDKVYLPIDVNYHTAVTSEYTATVCKSCSCILEAGTVNNCIESVRERHSFRKGACTLCGLRENDCAHEYVNEVCKHCGKFYVAEANAILVPEDTILLPVKGESQLRPVLAPEGAANEISYASSNSKIVTVSADGLLTAKKAGTAVITISTDNGVEKDVTVEVKKAATKVILSETKATVGAGESFQLSASVPADCYNTGFTWTSSNKSVATVDDEGNVTTLKAGKANITVKSDNGKSAKCAVTVKASPESITLSETALTLGEGQKAELSVSLPKNTAARIIWTASSDAVRVEDGVVTAVKAGAATVTATTGNGLASASCTVTVNPAPTAVIAEDVMLVVGQKYTATAMLQAGDVSYEGACSVKLASGKGIVTVNEKTGLITAKKAGTAVVTLTAYNGVSADCTITVVAAPKSVKLSASKKTLAEGENFELTATLSPANAYTDGYTVTMNKEGIVSVDGEDGSYTVTAIAAGKVKLTIAASNGKKASCTVTVK